MSENPTSNKETKPWEQLSLLVQSIEQSRILVESISQVLSTPELMESLRKLSQTTEIVRVLQETFADWKKPISDAMVSLSATSFAYKQYVEGLSSALGSLPILETLYAPTYALANLTESYGAFLESTRIEIPTVLPPLEEEKIEPEPKLESELDEMLNEMNPDYVGMLHGAWKAFYSDNPDKIRQSIVSIRELLNQILRQLAPEAKTRRERVKAIISSSEEPRNAEVEFIDVMASAIAKLSKLLSKVTHINYKHIESVRGILKAAEGIIYFLLVNRKS